MGVKGYVYFIRAVGTSRVKIGKANSIQSRTSIFEVKLPFKIKIEDFLASDDAYELETLFHQLFRKKHANGEWYNITDEEMVLIKQRDFDKVVANNVSDIDDYIYFHSNITHHVRKRDFKEDVKIRVNASLDQDTHNLLEEKAFSLRKTKTSLAAEIIKKVIRDNDYLKKMESDFLEGSF
jgi:hypothetical protein